MMTEAQAQGLAEIARLIGCDGALYLKEDSTNRWCFVIFDVRVYSEYAARLLLENDHLLKRMAEESLLRSMRHES